MENFSVLEYVKDIAVHEGSVITEYYKAEMNIRRRQVVIELNKGNSGIIQAGEIQWTTGTVGATSGVKGAKDLLNKFAKSVVINEAMLKPEYVGEGTLVLEPTYKYIILQEASSWGSEDMTFEDGMFLACDGQVKHKVVRRKILTSVVVGEGLFNCIRYNR